MDRPRLTEVFRLESKRLVVKSSAKLDSSLEIWCPRFAPRTWLLGFASNTFSRLELGLVWSKQEELGWHFDFGPIFQSNSHWNQMKLHAKHKYKTYNFKHWNIGFWTTRRGRQTRRGGVGKVPKCDTNRHSTCSDPNDSPIVHISIMRVHENVTLKLYNLQNFEFVKFVFLISASLRQLSGVVQTRRALFSCKQRAAEIKNTKFEKSIFYNL